jgi:hypothetical protein
VQTIRGRRAQRAEYTGRDTHHSRLLIGAISTRGEVAYKPTLRRKGTRIKTAHTKGESEGIGYVFKAFLLKRYLRSSTGSQE